MLEVAAAVYAVKNVGALALWLTAAIAAAIWLVSSSR